MPGTLKIQSGASFDFHGLVIVFDEFSLQPGAPADILGTVWMAASPGLAPKLLEFDPQGPSSMTYSCEAMKMVNDNWAAAFENTSSTGGWPIITWQELS